jgi:cell division protein FtsW
MGIQVLLIVGGTLRVVPLTGVTLPLVSYGGSSMLATSFSIGLILGIGAKGHDGGRQLRS